jgi:hypothetical protein
MKHVSGMGDVTFLSTCFTQFRFLYISVPNHILRFSEHGNCTLEFHKTQGLFAGVKAKDSDELLAQQKRILYVVF